MTDHPTPANGVTDRPICRGCGLMDGHLQFCDVEWHEKAIDALDAAGFLLLEPSDD